jgi:hypothetical protein
MTPQRLFAALVLTLSVTASAQDLPQTPEVPVAPQAPAAVAVAVAAARPEVTVDLSLFPPISLNGERDALNHLSLGLAAARSGELRGLALAPLHWAESDVTGVQLTWIGASARGTLRGLQASQLANVAHDVRGVQLTSIVNLARADVRGVQLATILNLAGREVRGWQGAVVGNYAPTVVGVQSGTVNVANRVAGLQLSIVNVGGDVKGSQIGVVNVARRVSGLQLGILNVADSADATVGVLSAVRDGRHALEVFATELSPFNVGLRLGGRRVYGLLVAGVDPEEQPEVGMTRWTAGLGVGAGFELGARVTLDVDLLAQSVRYDDEEHANNGLGTFRVIAGWNATPWMALFAGPTVSLLVSDDAHPDLELGRSVDLRETGRLWAGFVAGLRI